MFTLGDLAESVVVQLHDIADQTEGVARTHPTYVNKVLQDGLCHVEQLLRSVPEARFPKELKSLDLFIHIEAQQPLPMRRLCCRISTKEHGAFDLFASLGPLTRFAMTTTWN